MRALASGLLIVGVISGAGPTYAQLPFFSSEPSGADLRMASNDQLADEIAGFLAGVERQLTEAEADVQGLEAELANSAEVTDSSESLRRALLGLARQRLQLLAAARSTSKRAQDIAQAPLPNPGPTALGPLVELHVAAARLLDTHDALVRSARRLEDLAPDALKGGLGGPREAAEGRVQGARARAARARAYEAQAQARHAQRIAEAARSVLTLSARGAAEARTALIRAKARAETGAMRVAAQTEAPSPPAGTSSAAFARFDAEGRALMNLRAEVVARDHDLAEAEVLAAEALVWAYEAIDNPNSSPPEALEPSRMQARVDRTEAQRQEVDRTLRDLRQGRRTSPEGAPWLGLLAQQEELIEHTLGVVIEEERLLMRARVIEQVVEQVRLDVQHSSPLWLTVLLIALVLAAGFGLLKYGGQLLLWLIAPGVGRFQLSEKTSASANAVVSLVWPLIVLAGTASTIIWPVLGLQLSLLEAVQVLNHPLFYVDETGVSPVSIVQFILTIWAAVVISRLMRRFMNERIYTRTGWDIGLTNALNTLAHYVVLLIGSVVGLRFVGIGLSSLAILAGVLGIGIGFGLRNITENFISGLIILAERPIKIGDFIEVKDGEVEGRVERIQARSTTVTTRDNITMIIPNSEFVSRPVVNWSHGDPRVRVPISVGVAYGSDTDLVRKVLLEVAGRHGKVLKKPAPEVQFRAFGGSSLDFLLLIWIEEQYTRFRIASDLHFAIDKAFRKWSIEIAFPQVDMHFKSLHPSVMAAIAAPPAAPAAPHEGPNLPEQKSIRPRAAPAPKSTPPTSGET